MSLKGREKVTLLLASLPQEVREQILERLGDIGEELRRRLQSVDHMLTRPELLRRVVRELEQALTEKVHPPQPPLSMALRARQAYALQSPAITDTPIDAGYTTSGDPNASLLDRLRSLPASALARVLGTEQPAIVAIVLHALGPAVAAKVLPHLPAQLSSSVSSRLMTLRPPARRIVEQILRGLIAKLDGTHAVSSTPDGERLRWLAETIRQLPSSERTRLLEQLERQAPGSAQALRRLVYQLDDLVALPDRLAQRVIRKLDARLLAAATCDASLPVRNKVLRLVPERVAQLLKDLWSSEELTEEEKAKARDALILRLEELERQGEALPIGIAA